jgi:hypothetical protein
MRFCSTLLGALLVASGAAAQQRWAVEPQSSLAWWQINPHMSHLWATTCPAEPSWRPGEGHTGGWSFADALRMPIDAGISDTINVPLYPRYEARDICGDAVRGTVVAPDTATWRGVRGEFVVRANALVTGMRQRDEFAHRILETEKYPDLRFVLDSLTDVRRVGDSLAGTAFGVLTVHGVAQPMRASVTAFSEGGGLRVLAKMRTPARDLVREYGLSTVALGLGIGVRIWQDLFMGVDLLLREEPGGSPSGRSGAR